MSSAIVTGATGILGRQIVKQLGQDPQKWKKVYALSRSKKIDYPSNVEHRHIDLTSDAKEMAKELEGVEAEYVFFAAYLQQGSEQGSWNVNGAMFENFLSALETTGAAKGIKRVLLVTGAKYYGVHLGPLKLPLREDDPRLEGAAWPPNFYYRQQDALQQFCARNPHASWVVTYPNDVIGFAEGNFMNLATGVGLYAAISRELDGGGDGGGGLVFPGSRDCYTRLDTFTSSKLHGRFCEWAALEPRAANQAFNVVNGEPESWQSLWPRVARRLGGRVRPDQFAGEGRLPARADLAETVPVAAVADEVGLRGSLPPRGELAQRISLAKWAQLDEVKKAWERLAEREGLRKDALELATWEFVDFELGRNYDVVQSMTKARDFGWNGYCDTWKALSDVFGELEAASILPKTHRGDGN